MRNMGLPGNRRAVPLFLFLTAAGIVLPLLLWKWNKSFIWNTYGKPYELFELWGFCFSGVLFLSAGMVLHRLKGAGLQALLPAVLFFLTAFYFLQQFAEYSHRSWDYGFIENASRRLLDGRDPYDGTIFNYPPFVCQSMGAGYRFIHGFCVEFLHRQTQAETVWYLVFYFYQSVQYLLLLLAYASCVVFMRKAGVHVAGAAVLVSALFIFNNPMLRTLRFNQMNLWIFNCMLLSFLLLDKRPWLSGLLVALGAHIKIYPAILAVPYAVSRSFRAVAFFMAGVAGIFLAQTRLLTSMDPWKQYINLWHHFLRGWYYRDNSLHSLVMNTFKEVGRRLVFFDHQTLLILSEAGTAVLTLGMLVWFIRRFISREKAYRSLVATGNPGPWPALARAYGGFTDTMAMMLLFSPLAWEHHFIFVMPLLLWSFAAQGKSRLFLISIAAVTIYLPPTFDIFPFSYHRLAGLLLLLMATPPFVRERGPSFSSKDFSSTGNPQAA